MVKTIKEIVEESHDPVAMQAFVDLALGTPVKKKVKKFVTTIDPDTGRKKRTQVDEVVTEQGGRPDKQTLYMLLEMTGDLTNVDNELKNQKLETVKKATDEDEELFEELEGLT